MDIRFNLAFKTLLDEYNLPVNLDFYIDLPPQIQKILKSKIVVNEFGIGLKNNWEPCLNDDPDAQSFHEDYENHFHVDWYIDNATNKQVFKLGVRTLIELAKRFQSQNIYNIQLTYSLQTPEMGKIWAQENNIDDDEHFISDRLSFHTKRSEQIIVTEDNFNNQHWAFMIIDL